ncbi:MAG: Stp1/IreP family PP2C-type Ser/Thr phosphatase [Candidatus Competibacteraceae bacterium]
MQFDICLLTDPGSCRPHNEDCIRWIEPRDQRLLDRKGILAMVADGMGGHRAGQLASHLAVEAVTRSYYHNQCNHPLRALQEAFIDANRLIYRTSQRNHSYRGMGTTGTALVLKNHRIYFAHVGDCRLYRLRGKKLDLLTEDHTLVMEMYKQGLIDFEDIKNHPQRNIITRALGTRPEVSISTHHLRYPVKIGDCFVLCSDGLYDLVGDDEIKCYVVANSPNSACRKLIALAKRRGGYDNISIGIFAVRAAAQTPQKVSITCSLKGRLS